MKTTRVRSIPALLIGGLVLVGCSGAVRDVQDVADEIGGEAPTGVGDESPAPSGPAAPSDPVAPLNPAAPLDPSAPSDPPTPSETEDARQEIPPDTIVLVHERPATNGVRIEGVRINGTVYCRDMSGRVHFRTEASLSDCNRGGHVKRLAKTFQVSPAIGGLVITDLTVALYGGAVTSVDVVSPFSRTIGAGPRRRGGWSEITIIGPGGLYNLMCSNARNTYRLRYGIEHYEAEYVPLTAQDGESAQERMDRETQNAQRAERAEWVRIYFTLTEEDIANHETSGDANVTAAVNYYDSLGDYEQHKLNAYYSLPEEERSYAADSCRFTHSHGDPPYEFSVVPHAVTVRETGSIRRRGWKLSMEITTSSGGVPNVPPHDPHR